MSRLCRNKPCGTEISPRGKSRDAKRLANVYRRSPAPQIEVAIRQRQCRLSAPLIARLTRGLMRHVGDTMGSWTWHTVSIVIVDDGEMARLNAFYTGRAETTDVLSFAYPRGPNPSSGFDAEILVNAQRALAEGPLHRGPSRELALYIAHGCDHLSGENDVTPVQRMRMRRRELRWLRQAGASTLVETLFRETTCAASSTHSRARRQP